MLEEKPPESVRLPQSATELLERARRTRLHAIDFAYDDVGGRLLEYARELEAEVEALTTGGPDESAS